MKTLFAIIGMLAGLLSGVSCGLTATIQLRSSVEATSFIDQKVSIPISCNILLSGPIIDGDVEQLKDALTRIAVSRGLQDYIWDGMFVCLNSSGGSYGEALRIAELLMEHNIPTGLEDGAQCYSACAIIFMAGSYHFEELIMPARRMHPRAVLGFHAPYIVGGAGDRQYGKADIETAFAAGISAIRKLMQLGKRPLGNSSMRADKRFFPKDLLAEMLERGPEKLYAIETLGQALKYKIDLHDARVSQSNDDTALCSICVNKFLIDDWSEGDGSDRNMCGRVNRIGNGEVRIGMQHMEGDPMCALKHMRNSEGLVTWHVYQEIVFNTERRLGQDRFLESMPLWYYPPNTKLTKLGR